MPFSALVQNLQLWHLLALQVQLEQVLMARERSTYLPDPQTELDSFGNHLGGVICMY